MRSGKLVHVITVQRVTRSINASGTPIDTWSYAGSLRAEVVERAAQDFLEKAGETSKVRVVFRTRYLEDLDAKDRISFDGQTFEIEELVRIGRRKGLELHCTQIAEETRT